MTEAEVVALMESSRSEDEWNANCDAVRRDYREQTGVRDYPPFWFAAILQSGLAARVAARW